MEKTFGRIEVGDNKTMQKFPRREIPVSYRNKKGSDKEDELDFTRCMAELNCRLALIYNEALFGAEVNRSPEGKRSIFFSAWEGTAVNFAQRAGRTSLF